MYAPVFTDYHAADFDYSGHGYCKTIDSLTQDNTVITCARYVDVDGLVYDWSLRFHQYLCAFVNIYYNNWDTDCWWLLSKRVMILIPTPAMTAHKVRCYLVILILEHCIAISRSFDFLQTTFKLLLTCVVVMCPTGQTDRVVWVVTAASSALSDTLTFVFGGYTD